MKRTILILLLIGSMTSGFTAERLLMKDAYPWLSSGALESAELAELPAGILLKSGEMEIKQADIDSSIAKSSAAMRTQLKNNSFFLLENRAIGDLLYAASSAWAEQKGRPQGDKDEMIQAYFDDLTSKVAISDDEAKAFYEANKDMFGDSKLDDVKEDLKAYLLTEKRNEATQAHIRTLSERYIILINKAWAAKQYTLAMNNPVDKARKSGKPTFADFGANDCKPCKMMEPILKDIKSAYAGKINLVLVDTKKEGILSARFGADAIPLQVFFDKDGKEVFRHVGFFSKEQITAKLAEMGVK